MARQTLWFVAGAAVMLACVLLLFPSFGDGTPSVVDGAGPNQFGPPRISTPTPADATPPRPRTTNRRPAGEKVPRGTPSDVAVEPDAVSPVDLVPAPTTPDTPSDTALAPSTPSHVGKPNAAPPSDAIAITPAITIKLATVAPQGSHWQQRLTRLAQEWLDGSHQTVQLKVFAGGVQGEEADAIKKMRIGQLQAAALSVTGLGPISPAAYALAVPFMFRSPGEMEHVMAKVGPALEKDLRDQGFMVLAWTDVGAMHIYCRTQALKPRWNIPDRLRSDWIDVAAVPVATEEAWRATGVFTAARVNNPLSAVQQGSVDALIGSPLMASSLGWSPFPVDITAIPMGSMPGALVVTRKAWEGIAPDLQATLVALARQEAAAASLETRTRDAEFLKRMQSAGVKVVDPARPDGAEWSALEPVVFAAVRGLLVPKDAFDAVKAARDEFRHAM